MDEKEVQELIYTILKDKNFDFKSYPNTSVCYYEDGVVDCIQISTTFNFLITFFTKNLDLDYEIIQVITNYFLKLFKIHNFKDGGIIDLRRYNKREFQNLIDQYYLEMFGEENKLIQSGCPLFSHILRLKTNNLSIVMKSPLSETQLEECIKLTRNYEQWMKKKFKN